MFPVFYLKLKEKKTPECFPQNFIHKCFHSRGMAQQHGRLLIMILITSPRAVPYPCGALAGVAQRSLEKYYNESIGLPLTLERLLQLNDHSPH